MAQEEKKYQVGDRICLWLPCRTCSWVSKFRAALLALLILLANGCERISSEIFNHSNDTKPVDHQSGGEGSPSPLTSDERPADDWPTVIRESMAAVVLIYAKHDEGWGSGTGFLASGGVVVTNHHVIFGDDGVQLPLEMLLLDREENSINVDGLLYSDPSKDVAILRLGNDNSDLPSLQLTDGHPLYKRGILEQGQEVVALGHPLGFHFSAAVGHVSAIRAARELPFESLKAETNGVWIQHTASISPGNSGGPLINRSGEVVGMNTLYFLGGQNLNFAISAIDIFDAVKVARQSDLTPLNSRRGNLGQAIREIMQQTQ